jgi:Zn-dependent peptidase ImmA (M78 family)
MTREQLAEGLSRDGFTVSRGDFPPLVLYNEKSSAARRAFTLAHEAGHICLGHRDDSPQSEAEANLFAANLLMPRILLWELKRLRGKLCAEHACRVFLGSRQVARLQLLNLHGINSFGAAERELLRAYGNLLPAPGEPELGF